MLVFDMAGTIVNEKGIVYETLFKTMKNFKLNIESEDEIKPFYGLNKYEVLDHFLEKTFDNKKYINDCRPYLKYTFNNNLINQYSVNGNIELINKNLPDHFNKLRDNDIKICLNTGYSLRVQETIINSLNMKDFIDDYISSNLVKKGRPYPYMINHLMVQNNINFPNQVIKIGDTPVDILEGINSNCFKSVGVLSGASDFKSLKDAGADIILDSVMDIEIKNRYINIYKINIYYYSKMVKTKSIYLYIYYGKYL